MTKPFSITRQVRHFLVVALLLMSSAMASAQTTMFTYQGRLNDSGNAANGVVDMQFKLYDAADPSVSAQIGSTITNSNVAVTNGIFTVRLDFGASALPGANRFIEVGVRRISSDPYTVLAPRQQVTSAPYAIRSANSIVADQLSTACVGCVQDAQINAVAGSKVTGTLPASSIPAGNTNYIQNTTGQQSSSNFNISGNGTAGTLNAGTQYNLGGSRVLSIPGTNNIFAGVSAGQSNTGAQNSFFGTAAGFSNTSANNNSFFGNFAGLSNTTGNGNAFFGSFAGQNNAQGTLNDFFGSSAGQNNTMGSSNSFFGDSAGFANSRGNGNSFFGRTAGRFNTTGSNNTTIGFNANVGAGNLTNATAIGANAVVAQSNALVLGNGVNVGVGTTMPQAKLDVRGDVFVGLTAPPDIVSGAGNNLYVANDTGDANNSFRLDGFADNLYLVARSGKGSQAGAGIVFRTAEAGGGETSRVLIRSNGVMEVKDGAVINNVLEVRGDARMFNDVRVVGDLDVNRDLTIYRNLMISGTTTLGEGPGNGSAAIPLCVPAAAVPKVISGCQSSLRYKTQIAPFSAGMDIINRLRPIAFTWKQGGMRDIGFGAEEVEKVEPLLTFRNDKGEIEGVKYNQLSPVFVNALKEQQAQIQHQQHAIDSLRKQNTAAQNENTALKARLDRLEHSVNALRLRSTGHRRRHR